MNGRAHAAVVATCAAFLSAAEAQTADISEETGGPVWEARAHGVVVRLAQISPDQTRAFYIARGFDTESAERIAQRCVFQTIMRNASPDPLSFRLQDWRAEVGSKASPPLVDEDWQREWAARAVPASARTAFRWALFPSTQSYEAGDWNMGMTIYNLPHGSQFDLRVVWQAARQQQELVITGIQCANDNDVKKE